MERKSEIKSAYKSLGKAHSFYDGMMTGTTLPGRLIQKIVWGMDKEDALRRISVQMSNDEYAALGDFEIDNSGTVDELNEKVEELIKSQLGERGIRI